MALSPGAFPGSDIPQQVTALTGWTASDTLSVSTNSYAPWPAWSTRRQYTARDTPGFVPLCLACIVHVWRKRNIDARSIQQQGQGSMAIQMPVLIVDGNLQMTAMLQRYLTRQRVGTQSASSLAEAQTVLA